MEQLLNLLTWNTSARDPVILLFLVAAIAALIVVLTNRPKLYLPLILLTAPLPKLFTIAEYEVAGYIQTAPGFSVMDIVLAAGLAALLFQNLKRRVRPEAAGFSRALQLWAGSVALSVVTGLIFWNGLYRPINAVYALRYILTLAGYWAAVRYAGIDCSEEAVRRLLRRLAVAGNIVIALGLIYYFELGGSSAGGVIGINQRAGEDSIVFRSYLYFFDYGNDMGFYAVLVAILNLIMLADRRTAGLRLLASTGVLFCVITVFVIGERANLVVLGVAVGYFLLETSVNTHRSVRVSALFRIICVLVIVGSSALVLDVLTPQQITSKLENSVGIDSGGNNSTFEIMNGAGVPEPVIAFVSTLPIGDFAGRLALNVSGLWFFFRHPISVGFWGEVDVVGWASHHEIVKILVEQGIPGILAFVWLIMCLQRLLWLRRDFPGSRGQLGVLLRAVSVGMFSALIMANAALLDMKFAMVYWTLLGIWGAFPRIHAIRIPVVIVHEKAVNV